MAAVSSSPSPSLLVSSTSTTSTTVRHAPRFHLLTPRPSFPPSPCRPATRLLAVAPLRTPSSASEERVFFDGGAHYGDLVANLLLGFTLLWLPLTLAAVSRAFFLRYRFTNLRVTVVSGFTGQDRSDFSYRAIKDVQVVPRFIGEWGDIVITLRDGTKVDLRSVPKFREIADYCLYMAAEGAAVGEAEEGRRTAASSGPRGF